MTFLNAEKSEFHILGIATNQFRFSRNSGMKNDLILVLI